MDLKSQLAFCKQCSKREFNSQTGIVCSLTQRKPDFTNECSDFALDAKEAERLITKSYEAQEEEKSGPSVWTYVFIAFIIIKFLVRLGRS